MSSEFGKCLKVSVFGESHGKGTGVVIDGFPAGLRIDMDKLMAFLERRRPGNLGKLATARNETDVPTFISGITNGVTNGFPICAVIENADTRSKDYSELTVKPRPSHADYTARLRYGESVDMRGGGHFSGRLTAPLCVAGGLAMQLLNKREIHIGAHLYSVGNVTDSPFPLYPSKELFETLYNMRIPAIADGVSEKMAAVIEEAANERDSVGGIIECAVTGFPAGIGSPMFDGVENRLAAALFGVPAVKGVEFGSGFCGASRHGSENNDPFIIKDGNIRTEKNDSGGIIGGITTGMPITLKAAIKPTASIGKAQRTVNLETLEETELTVKGRHDPCIAVRAVPVIEAVTACVMLDMCIEGE